MRIQEQNVEDRLLCLCARPYHDESSSAEIERMVNNDLNWDYVLKRCRQQGVSSLMFHTFKNGGLIDGLPGTVLGKLRHDYYAASVNNALIFAETEKLLRILEQKKVAAIVLKGLSFAEHIYKNIALRPMSDADILIERKDLSRVNDIMTGLGYIQPGNYRESVRERDVSSINTLVYKKAPDSGFFIHLHWHLVNTTLPVYSLVNKIEMRRIWQSARPIRIGGINVNVLSDEHNLLYLACHSFNHGFDRLLLCADMLWFLKCNADTIDWKTVKEEAARFDLSDILYFSLKFASMRLGCAIPELENGCIEKRKSTSAPVFITYLLLQRSLTEKLSFLRNCFFPSALVMAHNLGLPVSQVRGAHYYRRIAGHFAGGLKRFNTVRGFRSFWPFLRRGETRPGLEAGVKR